MNENETAVTDDALITFSNIIFKNSQRKTRISWIIKKSLLDVSDYNFYWLRNYLSWNRLYSCICAPSLIGDAITYVYICLII